MPDTPNTLREAVVVRSPAKINWTLQVAGKRPDGYHDIASLVSVVTLYDQLEFAPSPVPGVAVECDVPGLPTDGENLICRAARMMAERTNRSAGLRCRLTKRIPVGGGLGGGSSNAAATLLALRRLWQLDWPPNRLAELAAELGSDVSLFLEGGSAVISGRGERVRPARLGWTGWIVLIMPGLSVSTPAVYRAWRPGVQEPRAVEPPPARNAVEWMNATFNMLEAPAIEVCPPLGALQREASRMADRPVRISGSGSTMFTAFDTRDEGQAFAQAVEARLAVRTELVQPVEQT
ncbi:MAG TPA: 4-(cytidine 5'-diphospho)-2-C-methyl-D-erythritol kinase [Phycisphaerae bacterium]|nr:4-(cytidine 5'-diphospho)-2-C-methyl-D-erythritol kinase [Phycisphaerae bacterium]HOJ74550.1 4-(cytidine 5'-diphospho)-2-C-methyl-D-erythritol kinase [Phycisphaerae bacterium]HOM52751.1 4-(cytidine 5'-diphospho)-2-C-methyl-D-erythritol kinase [Phycisphaerae bacterium]HON67017.1 4-(cytidine 5'-diphospho)-2-C-methyl-D-erythritol kinase [Phycisphaerae bacterium]HOQ87728.1 4-(cytidine 5'-diphospho)-2-C-methyl-D-erythritol kinase [Phycisphaerae bacterium]